MKKSKTTVSKHLMLGCAISLALFASAGKLRANTEETIDKTFTVAAVGMVVTDVDWGSIEVATHPGNDVIIHVWRKVSRTDKAEEEQFLRERPVTFSLEGEIVTIRSHRETKGKQSLNAGEQRTKGKYTITVPAKFNVRLKTAGGGIAVGDLVGEVKTDTSGGELKFTRIRGPVNGHTSGGGIQVIDCEGTLKIDTSGGGVTIKNAVGKVDIKTSGGPILASFSSPFSDDVRLETSGGDVTMHVAANSAFNLEASTSAGGVSSEVPVTTIGEVGRHQLKGAVNGGGKSVVLHTSGGSIQVKKL